jgi:hypothetical protein
MARRNLRDYFVIDVEPHIMPSLEDISYFPGVKRINEGIGRLIKDWIGPDAKVEDLPKSWSADDLIAAMDEGGVDMACALPEEFMDTSWDARRWSTNGWVLAQCEKYPDRLIFQSNVGPIMKRGVEHAIWELEYLVKEKGNLITKVYAPGDGYINDPKMWPFYKKCVELGVIVTMHTGAAHVPPSFTKYTHPLLLDDICLAFPDLKIIAFHFGWPWREILNHMAQKHPNLYISVSGNIGRLSHAPRLAAEWIGEALYFAGADRIIFGCDWPVTVPKSCVNTIINLEIPEDLQKGYGYPPITEDDKRKILGLNLAKLLGGKAEEMARKKLGPLFK